MASVAKLRFLVWIARRVATFGFLPNEENKNRRTTARMHAYTCSARTQLENTQKIGSCQF